MQYHFIYKTYVESGKYYIGRHSTENLNDGYQGSGNWVLSIKDKSILTTEILEFVDSYDAVKLLEQEYLDNHVGKENCMNWNNQSSGFATGERNWACFPESRKYKSENSWMKTDKGRKWASENSPARLPHVREMNSKRELAIVATGSHNFQRKDVQAKTVELSRQRCIDDNPAKKPEARKKLRICAEKELEAGTHNFQKVETRENARLAIVELANQGLHPFQRADVQENARKVNSARMKSDRHPLKTPEGKDAFRKTAMAKRPKVDIDKLKQLYIIENNSREYILEYFGINSGLLESLCKENSIKKLTKAKRPKTVCPQCNIEGDTAKFAKHLTHYCQMSAANKAKLSPNKRNEKMSKIIVNDLKEFYCRRGITREETALEFGISLNTLAAFLVKNNITKDKSLILNNRDKTLCPCCETEGDTFRFEKHLTHYCKSRPPK